jgi:hypothetical protein
MSEFEELNPTCEQKRKKGIFRNSSSYYDSSFNPKYKNVYIEDEGSDKKEKPKDDGVIEYSKRSAIIAESLFGDPERTKAPMFATLKKEEKTVKENGKSVSSFETCVSKGDPTLRNVRKRVDSNGIVVVYKERTTTTKKKPKTRTKRSQRSTSKTIVRLPKEALSLVTGFERDLPFVKVGIREREWLDRVLKTTRNQILYEELSCAVRMITKNVLKCIFEVTFNDECLYLMDIRRVEKKKSKEESVRKKAIERTRSMSVSKSKEDRIEEKKYVKFESKIKIARDHDLINAAEIERILGFFFFSSKSKTVEYKTTLGVDSDSSPSSKRVCNSTSCADVAVSEKNANRYEDIHSVFREWSRTHEGIVFFVVRLTERLLSFCQRVKNANARGYHSNCEACSSKISELYPAIDNAQRNSSESSFRSPFATFDDDESIIFSIVLKETLNFYFSDKNRLRFSKARHPLSDPSRRERLFGTKLEDPKSSDHAKYVHPSFVNEEEEEEEEEKEKDEEKEAKNRERSMLENLEGNKSLDLLRQTSAPSLLYRSRAKKIKEEEPVGIVEKPYDAENIGDGYVYENTNEICRFFIYGDKRSLIERLKTIPATTKRKGLFRSKSSKELFYARTKEKKRATTINTNNLFAIFRMHPVQVWKILTESETLTNVFTDEIVLKDVVCRIAKMYLILLWEVD